MLTGTHSKYLFGSMILIYIASKIMNKRILQKDPINLSLFKSCQAQTCLSGHGTSYMFTGTTKSAWFIAVYKDK